MHKINITRDPKDISIDFSIFLLDRFYHAKARLSLKSQIKNFFITDIFTPSRHLLDLKNK